MAVPDISPFQGMAMTNPAWNQPIQQQHAYEGWNPDTKALQSFAGQAGGWGNQLLGQGSQLAGQFGNLMSNPSQLMSTFGVNIPDIANPATRSRLNMWNQYQNQNIMNPLQQNLGKIAGAGVASGRGGFGVQGGAAGPEARLQQQAIQQVAGSAQQNLQNSMGWMSDAARLGISAMNPWMSAMGSLVGSELGAGQGMYGQQRGALNDILGAQERRQAGYAGEEAANVTRYNQMLQQLPQNQWAMEDRVNQQAQQKALYDQKQGALDQLKLGVSQGAGTLGPWAWQAGMAPIWQQQAGITPGTYGAGGSARRGAGGSSSTLSLSDYSLAAYLAQQPTA